MILNPRLELSTLAENTLSQTADYNGAVLVNILKSILLTSQKAITIDVTGKQARPKQIIFYRQDTDEENAESKHAAALNFARVFVGLYNQKFGKAPVEIAQLSGITIREQDKDESWSERLVDLITVRHTDNANISFIRRSAFYYRSFAQMIIEGFVEIIDQQRRQT